MSLITEVRLELDQSSRKRLTAAMAAAGHEGGDKLAKEIAAMTGPAAERLARKIEADLKRGLEKGTAPAVPKANIEKIDTAMDKLRGTATRIGAALLGAFAVTRLVAWGRSALTAAVEADASWGRLGQTLKGVGVELADVRNEVDQVIGGLKATRFDNDDLAESLGSLVIMTGDYNRSLGALQVVADLAAAKHMSLEQASLLVGKAMNGNIEQLGRLGIVIPKGTDALEALRAQFKGFAAGEGKEAVGVVGQYTTALGDAQEALGGFMIESAGGISILGRFTAMVRGLADALNIYSVSAKHASEIALGDTEKEIARLRRSIENSLTTKDGKVVRGSVAGLDQVNPNNPAQMAALDEMGRAYVRLLAVQRELTIEVNQAARAQFAQTQSAHEAAETAARAAKAKRDAEANTEASLKRQKEALEQMARAARAWEAGRQSEAGADAAAVRATPVSQRVRLIEPNLGKLPGESTFARDSALIGEAAHDAVAGELGAAEARAKQFGGAVSGILNTVRTMSVSVADTMVDHLGGAFKALILEGGTLKQFLASIGDGMANAILGQITLIAKGKAKENLAYAVEALAHGIFAAAKGDPRSAGFFASAKTFGLAAAGWGAAAAGIGALGGGEREASAGGGGFAQAGRTNAGGALVSSAQPRGGDIHIRIDGIDPGNPRHHVLVGETVEQYRERFGGDVYVNGRRG